MTRISSRALGIGIISVACALLMTACETTSTSSSGGGTDQIQETEGDFRAPVEPDAADVTRPGRKLELRPVYFGYDRSDLTAEARTSLREDGELLRNSAGATTIEGHTDERGTLEYNLALGDRRANVVKKYLVALGLPASELRTKSYGEMRPAVTGHDESVWRYNRRVVLQH